MEDDWNEGISEAEAEEEATLKVQKMTLTVA